MLIAYMFSFSSKYTEVCSCLFARLWEITPHWYCNSHFSLHCSNFEYIFKVFVLFFGRFCVLSNRSQDVPQYVLWKGIGRLPDAYFCINHSCHEGR